MPHERSKARAGIPTRALLCVAISAALAANARAALLTVTNANDSGAGSLRNAVATAAAGDVIRIPPTFYSLTSGQISITQDLVIESPGAASTIDGGRHSRLFNVANGVNAALANLIVTRGLLSGNGGDHDAAGGAALGAGIANAGNLSLANVAITANAAAGGGAGGCLYNSFGTPVPGGGGGGGGGFSGVGGGHGGAGTVAGSAAFAGAGGAGGDATTGIFMNQGGKGGALNGGSGGSGVVAGYAGASAALAGVGNIGGGGAGGSSKFCADVASARGGNAAGGLYNASTGNVFAFGGTYLKNNLAAAGGSVSSSTTGLAAGAVYNKGHFSIGAAGAGASATNAGAGRTGSSNTFVNDGGVQNLAYAIATPTLGNLAGDSVQYTQGDTAIYLDSGIDATLTDADAPNFFGGHVNVRITANSSPADVLGIANQGNGAGQVGVSGSVITYSGVPVGAFGSVSATWLSITFSSAANATSAAAQAVLRALTYTNSNTSNPSLLPRTVAITVDDGHGGTTAAANVTVNVASSISLTVTDNTDYAAYGQTAPYTVTLSNTGLGTASGMSVSSSYPSGLDGANAQWTCVPANGATCNAGAGTFADTATLPPQSSATWIVNVPVPLDTAAPTAEIDVSATGATAATDVDTLVIFRDGYE